MGAVWSSPPRFVCWRSCLAALEAVLAAWPGGLLVVSHDPEFLDAIGIERTVTLAL